MSAAVRLGGQLVQFPASLHELTGPRYSGVARGFADVCRRPPVPTTTTAALERIRKQADPFALVGYLATPTDREWSVDWCADLTVRLWAWGSSADRQLASDAVMCFARELAAAAELVTALAVVEVIDNVRTMLRTRLQRNPWENT